MIAMYGVYKNQAVVDILKELNLKHKIDYIFLKSSTMIRTLPRNVQLVSGGKDNLKRLGIKGTGINGTLVHSNKLGRSVYVVTSPNSAKYNPNVAPQFKAQIGEFFGISKGYNFEPKYEVIETPRQFGDVGNACVFDIESSGSLFYSPISDTGGADEILFVAFAFSADKAFIVRRDSFVLYHDLWLGFFRSTKRTFIAHNAIFDINAMHLDLDIPARVDFCTMQAHHRLHAGEIHRLKNILYTQFGFPPYEKDVDAYVYNDTAGHKKFDRVPEEVFFPYAATDVVGEFLCYERFSKELKERDMYTTFTQDDMPFVNALAHTERNGRTIDYDWLMQNANKRLTPIINHNTQVMREMAGDPKLNPNSTQQLAKVFVRAKMPNYRLSDGTGKPVLEKLLTMKLTPDQRKFIDVLTEYRSNKKISSSYVNNLWRMLDIDYKLHPHHNPTGTVIGRISMNNPALQTIPKTDAGKFIRQAYKAIPDHVYLLFDGMASQLRICASQSGDPNMLKAFNTVGGDLHATTLAPIFDYLPQYLQDDPTNARKIAKNTNFAMVFEGTLNTLVRKMPYVDLSVLQLMYESFKETYSVYNDWAQEQIAIARQDLKITNMFGYSRAWPSQTSQIAEQAVNFKITSIESYVMNRSYHQIWKTGMTPILHLHDEIQTEVLETDMDRAAGVMLDIMINNYKLVGDNVRWGVDGKAVRRWLPIDKSVEVLKEYEGYSDSI